MYRSVRADDFSVFTMQQILVRAKLLPGLVEDVLCGCVRQTEEHGYNIARQAVFIAGLPLRVGGVTVNRNCGSSIEAINQAVHRIATQCEDILIAGGVEHMHRLSMGLWGSTRVSRSSSVATAMTS